MERGVVAAGGAERRSHRKGTHRLPDALALLINVRSGAEGDKSTPNVTKRSGLHSNAKNAQKMLANALRKKGAAHSQEMYLSPYHPRWKGGGWGVEARVVTFLRLSCTPLLLLLSHFVPPPRQ